MKRVTLVLVCQHAEHVVEATLGQLAGQGLVGESSIADVRVVACGLTSSAAQRIAEAHPGIEIAGVPAGFGFARAANAGLHDLESQFALLLTPGIAISRNLVDTLMRYVREHPMVGAAGPLFVDKAGRTTEKIAAFPTPLGEVARRLPRSSRIFGLRPPREQLRHSPGRVDWLPATCLLIRRRALDEVGLLDEACNYTFDEADWCRRAWTEGWEVHQQPAARAVQDPGLVGRWRNADRIASLRERLSASRRHYFRVHHGVASAALVELAHGLGNVFDRVPGLAPSPGRAG